MSVLLASQKKVAPYWVQEAFITHPFDIEGGPPLGWVELFLTVALVCSEDNSTLNIYHDGPIEDFRDESEPLYKSKHWWWDLTQRFTERSLHRKGRGIRLHHEIPHEGQRAAIILEHDFNISEIGDVTWLKFPIYRQAKQLSSKEVGGATIWPLDPLFKSSDKLLKKTFGKDPFVRIKIDRIPRGTWLLRLSFITKNGLFAMGDYDTVLPVHGPSKVLSNIEWKTSTNDTKVSKLLNEQWPGMGLVRWLGQVQYDVAGLAPLGLHLREERMMFPANTEPVGLIDIKTTRSGGQRRFSAYALRPESVEFEAAFRIVNLPGIVRITNGETDAN